MSDSQQQPKGQSNLVAELMRTTCQLQRRLRTENNPDELSMSQVVALARLTDSGLTSIADLARMEAVRPQSMGATLRGLEGMGLVERHKHPSDGRCVLFGITERGAGVLQRRRLLRQEWLIREIKNLDEDEQETLARAVELLGRLCRS